MILERRNGFSVGVLTDFILILDHNFCFTFLFLGTLERIRYFSLHYHTYLIYKYLCICITQRRSHNLLWRVQILSKLMLMLYICYLSAYPRSSLSSCFFSLYSFPNVFYSIMIDKWWSFNAWLYFKAQVTTLKNLVYNTWLRKWKNMK